MRTAAKNLARISLGLAALASGCAAPQAGTQASMAMMPETQATTPDFACPWLDAERYHAPVKRSGATGTSGLPPPRFVQGCAIIRFRVAADGSTYKAALRAANPLDDGPTALSALQDMRFQPGPKAESLYVIRLSMQRDGAGHIAITTETRQQLAFLENDW